MYQRLVTTKDIQAILKCIKKYGIAIVPSYIMGEELDRLRNEFFSLTEYEGDGLDARHKHPTNEDGIVTRVKREALNQKDFPVTKKVFGSQFFEEIVSSYYAPSTYKLNDDIFLTHEKPCETPILPWHFDRVQSLKFFIYLKDVTKNDGAFEYAPGTHNEGHFRANYNLAIGTPLQNLPNDIPEEEILNPLTIEGHAGDLIIFDSDGFHRGGTVGPGGERMVMRGHSHPHPVYVGFGSAKILSINWWIQSKFNLANLFKSRYSRILGRDIQSKAAKNRDDL